MAVVSGIANSNPARIARIVRWLAVIGLAVLGAVFLSRRIYMLAFISWGAALAVWRHGWARLAAHRPAGDGPAMSRPSGSVWR